MKKIFTAIVCSLMAISANAQVLKGDINNDKSISVGDVAGVVKYALGQSPWEYISLRDLSQPVSIEGTWYKSKNVKYTFNSDGTTDYPEASTYLYFPKENYLLLVDEEGSATGILNIKWQGEDTLMINKTIRWTRQIPTTYVSSITLNTTSIQLYPETTSQLTAEILPIDADSKSVVWTSSDPGIAKVENGLVTALSAGTVTITCTASDGSGVSAKCTVKVTPRANPGGQVGEGSGA